MTTSYEHNGLYVYDAESQTFQPYAGTIHQLEAALARIKGDGYHCFVSVFSVHSQGTVDVSLGRHASKGLCEIAVKGRGNTVEEAFQMAFDNFPKDPLDGSKWVEQQKLKELSHD